MKRWLVVILVSAVTAAVITYSILRTPTLGATIFSTASSDTINTFRTNVNTSLTNLNNAIVGIVSTSTALTAGQLLYATGVATMGGVATTTATFSGPFTISGTLGALVGGSNSTITWSGLATTSALTAGQVLYASSVSGVTSIATSTPSATYPFQYSGTLGNFLGGASGAFSLAFGTTTSNTWAGLQTFNLASSTQFSAASELFYIDSTGKVAARDTTNSWSGRLSPTRSFTLATATTTTWTGTTSAAYVPSLTMPFAGTLRQVRCTATSTQAFLGIAPRINTTATTPDYLVASTTVGVTKFTANNTFSAGDRINMYVGTSTASSNNIGVDCTFDVTET